MDNSHHCSRLSSIVASLKLRFVFVVSTFHRLFTPRQRLPYNFPSGDILHGSEGAYHGGTNSPSSRLACPRGTIWSSRRWCVKDPDLALVAINAVCSLIYRDRRREIGLSDTIYVTISYAFGENFPIFPFLIQRIPQPKWRNTLQRCQLGNKKLLNWK